MRRRPSTPSVTLFPFLAVLVCTMGALIFLLLVITQKIHKQPQFPLVSIEQPVEIDLPDIQPPVSETPPATTLYEEENGILPLLVDDSSDLHDDEPILPLLAGNTLEENQWLEAEYAARQNELQRKFAEKLKRNNEKQLALDRQWQANASSLSIELNERQQRKKELLNQRKKLEEEIALLDTKLAETKQVSQLTEQQLAEAIRAQQREQEERFRLQSRAAELTRQIARLEERNQNAIPQTQIVAYDSVTGTSRKPILIECRESEIIFASEGIKLSAIELSGFPPEYNPLKAGAESLLKFWQENGQPHERPYLLLVVRPRGTTGFYVARGLLSELDHKFGYELVEEDREIRWPKADPVAMHHCQEAISAVLKERERVAARLGRMSTVKDGPLSYSNLRGEFSLPESESMDRSGSGNFIGDERWISPKSRKAQSANSLERYSPSDLSQRGGPPRSIARPVPSATPQDLLNGSHGRSQQSDQKQIGTSENSRTQSGIASREDYQVNGRPRSVPSQFSAENAKPIQEPGIDNLLPKNPFETSQSAAKPGAAKQYGMKISPPQKSGVIGIERETEVHLWEEQIRIDDEIAFKIPRGTEASEVKEAVTSAIAKATQQWKAPPKSYFWKPVVKIVIHPGGLLHYAKVKELIETWNIPGRVEYELQ